MPVPVPWNWFAIAENNIMALVDGATSEFHGRVLYTKSVSPPAAFLAGRTLFVLPVASL